MRTLLVALVLGCFVRPTGAGPKPGYGPIAAGNRCLELAGAKLFSSDCDGSAKQQWKLTAVKGGYVQITSQLSGDGKCLDIVNDGRSNNRLTVAACSNVSGQHWKLVDGHLTTEWRGDGKCLDIVDSTASIQPVLSDCAKSATQSWTVGSSAPAAATSAKPDVAFEPTFFVVFQDCAFAMPGIAAGKPWTSFGCTRATKQRAVCRVVAGHLDDVFQPSRSVFEATITADTATALAFATSDDDISIRVSLNDVEATLTQRISKVRCKGVYGTAANMKRAMKEAKRDAARAAQQQDTRDDSATESAPSPSRSTAPEPKARAKGSARGRMCGKDSDCESGSCKMENRTRGRCS